MQQVDELIQFIIDALSANAAKGYGSVVTIKIAPYIKASKGKKDRLRRTLTDDDVIDAHEALETFDGDFKKLFGSRK